MMRARWLWLLLLGTSGCVNGGDDCTVGETRCNDGNPARCDQDCSDFGCSNRWVSDEWCTASQTCIAPTGMQPVCAESSPQDPLCAASVSATYCSANELVLCDHGYRAISRTCGGSYSGNVYPPLPGGSASTACVDPGDGNATCIPPAAKLDPRCDGVNGRTCVGSTLVECVDHYAVFTTTCASCTTQTGCHGYLGDGCTADGDCAAGLVCHDTESDNGQTTCTLPCTVGSAGEPDAGAPQPGAPNAQCYAAFNPDRTPISAYSETYPSGQLSCIAGYCKWAP